MISNTFRRTPRISLWWWRLREAWREAWQEVVDSWKTEKEKRFDRINSDPKVHEYRRLHPERLVFVVDGKCISSDEVLYAQCRVARAQRLPELIAALPPNGLSLAIVGSGPSVDIEEVKKHHGPIMALKGAHDWLIERGITPHYAVAADPQQSRARCFKLLNDETIYFCASQMHPDTWEHLKGRKVIIWHSQNDAKQPDLPEWRGVPLVPGGSTTGMRAMPIAYLLGYRDLQLFGFDSSVKDGAYKVDGSPVKDGDSEITVWVGEREFKTCTLMIPQVEQLKDIARMMPGVKITAHGDGLFQEVLKQGKLAGWPV